MNQERSEDSSPRVEYKASKNPRISLVKSGRPTWQIVILLTAPVLAQQFLVLLVMLSDRFLVGNLPVAPEEQAYRISHFVAAMNELGAGLSGALGRVASAQPSLQAAKEFADEQIAMQAAQTTATYLNWFISSFTVLVSVGSTALVARFTGAGDEPAANRVAHQSLLLAACLGLVASTSVWNGLLETLIGALQLRGEAAAQAINYLRPIILLLPFQMVQVAGVACLVGAGDTRTGLFVMLGIALVNVPISWGLALGLGPLPRLGFVGVALGTAVSHMLGGGTVLTVLAVGRYHLKLDLRLFRPNVDLLRRILRISVPAGIDSLSTIAGQFWFLSIVNRLGDVASSAHGIAIVWEALGFLSGVAFGTAAMTLVGQNLGAEQPRKASSSGWLAFGMGCLQMTLMGVVFYTLARPMFELFCPKPSQGPIISAGVPVLQLVAFAMPSLAATIILTHALRGAGDTRMPVVFTWIGLFCIRIPLAYCLALSEIDLGPLGRYQGWGMGLFGAWMAMFVDLLVRGCFILLRFASGTWQRVRV